MPNEPRPDMVGWYDPAQLFRTGLQTVLTEVFATRADFRLLMALGHAQEPHRLDGRDALWVDYLADTGDGWRPTTAVLHAVASADLDGGGERLPRGDLLVLGGDPVYPSASVQEYERRLVAPMRAVSAGVAARPEVLAVPGNHDWYDGLVGFVSTFLQKGELGMWQTFQQRSYHCVKLPHRHWLLAVDTQLQADLDVPQRQWFESALKDLGRGDHVVVCAAEPFWVFRQQYGKGHGPQLAALVRYITEARGARVVLWLAGDLHHYRRMERADDEGRGLGEHFVTAGGGGAFLHPTHTPSVARLTHGRRGEVLRYALHREYPAREVSRALSFGNLAFLWFNPRFGLVTAALYTLLSWLMPTPDVDAVQRGVWPALRHGMAQFSMQPSANALVIAVLVAVVYFTDSHRPLYRVTAGLLHGLSHLGAALAAAGLGLWIERRLGVHDVIVGRTILNATSALVGYLLGSAIMGTYLFVSVYVFRRHANEAFSSLKLEGWKNFLRLRVDARGLSLWAFGLERVAARWSDAGVPEPADARERPVVIDTLHIPAPAAEEATGA